MNPADMDINANTSFTFSSGDSTGITYGIGSTNATGAAPTATTSFYYSNPGSFAVTGTVVAAAQGTFNDTPSQLVFSTDRESEIYYEYNINNSQAQPILVPGSSVTCTIFDAQTNLGSVTTIVGGFTIGGVTNAFVQCAGVYPNGAQGPSGNGHAFINLPSTYNSGDVYTYIISH